MMKKRDYRLDLLRVLSMIMVVIIHIANYYCRSFNKIDNISYIGALIFNTISRVSVPFFFMISGATLLSKEYDKKKNIERIVKKSITLIAFTIIYFFWDKYFMNRSISVYNLFNTPERKMLWFMYAIIGIYISLPFIKCMIDKMGKDEDKLFVILWIIINGILKSINIGNHYLIPVISGTYYLGYFIIGYLIIKYKDYLSKKMNNKIMLIISIFMFLIIISTTYYFSISTGKHYTNLLTYSNIFIIISSLLCFIYFYLNISDKEYKLISILSNLSFGIYLVHGIVLDYIMKLIPYHKINSFIGIPIILIFVTFITCIIVSLLKKTYISKFL